MKNIYGTINENQLTIYQGYITNLKLKYSLPINVINDLVILFKATSISYIKELLTKLQSLESMKSVFNNDETKTKQFQKIEQKELDGLLDNLTNYYKKENKIGLIDKNNINHKAIKRCVKQYCNINDELNDFSIAFNNQQITKDFDKFANLQRRKTKVLVKYYNICSYYLDNINLTDVLDFLNMFDELNDLNSFLKESKEFVLPEIEGQNYTVDIKPEITKKPSKKLVLDFERKMNK